MNLGKDLTVSDLEAKIKTDRPDLEEINIELYRKDFFQENNVLINTVNSDKPEKRQGFIPPIHTINESAPNLSYVLTTSFVE
ncbi:uncharacterized protein OCT59_024577 [Rhizophagus irregularis]|uniref:uncharacterized protein n=1 Tax=Rhizophagus irregularis TaxID=588596 RepID=UPI003332635F|nr:hypothetical protein OCT59_024577 [Rhizophagus irregularis]